MQDTKKIQNLLEKSKKIAIFGHNNPDGDCIGSMLGLGRLLEKQGKKVSYYTPSAPSKMFEFLPKTKQIKTTFDYGIYDCLVFVDFTGYGRIETFTRGHEEYFKKTPLIIIDHHIEEPISHALAIKDTEISSCCELLFESFEKVWKKHIDPEIATYLYLGLMTDTGNFMFDKDAERTLSNALHLVQQ